MAESMYQSKKQENQSAGVSQRGVALQDNRGPGQTGTLVDGRAALLIQKKTMGLGSVELSHFSGAAPIQLKPPSDPHVFQYTDQVGRAWSRDLATDDWYRPGPKGEKIFWTPPQEHDEEVVPSYSNGHSSGTAGFALDAAEGRIQGSGASTVSVDRQALREGRAPVLYTVPFKGHGGAAAPQLHIHSHPDDPSIGASHFYDGSRSKRFITNEYTNMLINQHIPPQTQQETKRQVNLAHRENDMEDYGHVRPRHMSGLEHALRGDYK